MNASYKELEKIFKKIKLLENTVRILDWDQAVIMPPGSANARAEQTSTIKLLSHQLLISKETEELIASVNEFTLSEFEAANFRIMKRDQIHGVAVASDLLEASSKASINCELIWRKAKEENDYKSFLPHFKEVINLTIEIAQAKSEVLGCGLYEACVDQFDPNLKGFNIETIFTNLEEFLPTFIDIVVEKQKSILSDSSSPYNQFNSPANLHEGIINIPPLTTNMQNKIGLKLMQALGFNFAQGRLDISAHPFCGGIPEDVRITTKYNESDPISGIMGVVHETGHALYEQNLPRDWIYQPLGTVNGMAIHESQALIVEMQICRSKEFCRFLQNLIIKELGNLRSGFSEVNLFRTINRVKPSFIRIDADEVTYPLHVLLRYKLEKALINRDLTAEDLPNAWNELTNKLLKIQPNNLAEGCMQDIHWPCGMFGYFPSYTIGSIMAAQFFSRMKLELPNLMSSIGKGDFQEMNHWLKQKIHNHGSRYSSQEIIYNVSGKELDLDNYKNYLQERFINDFLH